ncbi:MAG: hypothetical protein Q9218_004376 [Villophora microphyllina]
MNAAFEPDGPLYLQQLSEEIHARAQQSSSTTVVSAVLLILLGYQIIYWLDYPVLSMSEFLWNSAVRATPSKILSTLDTALLSKISGEAKHETEQSQSQKHAQKSESMRRLLGMNGSGVLSRWQGTRSGQASNGFLSSNSTKKNPPGLGNWDNSCYQNSVIQGLASLPSFSEFLHHPDSGHPSQSTRASLADIIRKLKDHANLGSMFWTPVQLKSMSSWQQQDAQEYFSKLMDEVERETAQHAEKEAERVGLAALETLSLEPSRQSIPGADQAEKTQAPSADANLSLRELPDELQSIIARNPLDGLLAQRVGCLKCGFVEGLSLIPFNCLTLPLGKHWLYDIRSCLDEYTALEPINDVDCAKCTLLHSKTQLEKLQDQFSDANGQALQSSAPLVTEALKASVSDRLQAVNEALEVEDFSENTILKKCQIPSKSKVSSTKTRQAVVARAPKSMAIHINRSVFDETTGMLSKNYADVRFPLRFSLKAWCLGGRKDGEHWSTNPAESMLLEDFDDEEMAGDSTYELRAALTHYGRHENGHYVCYRRQETSPDVNNKVSEGDKDVPWWRFSDEDVSPVSQDNVLAQGDVFMLFYERIYDPLPPAPIHDQPPIEQRVPVVEKQNIDTAADKGAAVHADSDERLRALLLAEENAKVHEDETDIESETPPQSPVDHNVDYQDTVADACMEEPRTPSLLRDTTSDFAPAHEPISQTQTKQQQPSNEMTANSTSTNETVPDTALTTDLALPPPSDAPLVDPSPSHPPDPEASASPLSKTSQQSDPRNIPYIMRTPTPRSGRGSMSRGRTGMGQVSSSSMVTAN